MSLRPLEPFYPNLNHHRFRGAKVWVPIPPRDIFTDKFTNQQFIPQAFNTNSATFTEWQGFGRTPKGATSDSSTWKCTVVPLQTNTDLTVATWVRPVNGGANSVAVCRADATFTNGAWALGLSGGSTYRMAVFESGSQKNAVGGTVVSEPVCLVGTVKGTAVTLYLNGVSVGTATLSANMPSFVRDIAIYGKGTADAATVWAGNVYDVIIADRAWDPWEALDYYKPETRWNHYWKRTKAYRFPSAPPDLVGGITLGMNVTGNISTQINLAGNVPLTMIPTGNLSTGINLLGNIPLALSVSSILNTSIQMLGAVPLHLALAGNLDTQINLAGNIPLNLVINGVFSGSAASLVGAIALGVTVGGPLTTSIKLVGNIPMGLNLAGSIFTTAVWNSPQDQINAGYPVYIEPTELTASYQEVIDYGIVIDNTILNLNYTLQQLSLDGTVSLISTIEFSLNGTVWGPPTTGKSAFSQSFRYARITINFTSSNKKAFAAFQNLSISLNVKKEIDSGQATAISTDPTGTQIFFNKAFVDVDSVTATADSIEPLYVVIDFVDVPNPTSFRVYVYDSTGNRTTYPVSWKARGIV